MTLHKIWNRLVGTTAPVDKTDEALKLADEVIEKACVAAEKLSVYENEDDPFTAFLVDIYHKKQVDNLYKRF